MIDCVNGLVDEIRNNAFPYYADEQGAGFNMATAFTAEMFCPVCGANRKHSTKIVSRDRAFRVYNDDEISFDEYPVIHTATCLQCDTITHLVLYQGPEELELAILRNSYGGCVTEHTPEEVKFYIDQASRARMMGALSASMAMYRSALEWILYDQGYEDGMLGKKIIDLQNDVKNNSAPKWTTLIDPLYFTAIKNLGNGAIHTNSGDITKQAAIDKQLIETVDVILSELLDVIYEQPFRRADNLEKLVAISDSFLKD